MIHLAPKDRAIISPGMSELFSAWAHSGDDKFSVTMSAGMSGDACRWSGEVMTIQRTPLRSHSALMAGKQTGDAPSRTTFLTGPIDTIAGSCRGRDGSTASFIVADRS